MTPKTNTTSIYQIKVTLHDIRPPIWRRILVPGTITLFELHYILQAVMGWTNSHLHYFLINEVFYGDPEDDEFGDFGTKEERKFKLNKLVPHEGFRFEYEYDFGDSWDHVLLVEKIFAPEKGQQYPVCIKGKRACPPEDVGGPWGYDNFIKAIQDTNHPEHDEYLEWIGGEFDPEEFDLEEVNEMLYHFSSREWENSASHARQGPAAAPSADAFRNPARWQTLFIPENEAVAEQLALRKDALVFLNYLQENKITGTQSTGNLPRKAVEGIAARMVKPPVLEETIGEHVYRFRSEDQVWPIYYLHLLLVRGGLISGGQSQRWQVTTEGEKFLSAPSIIQLWVLFAAWWLRIEWEAAFPFSGLETGLPENFKSRALDLLLESQVGIKVDFNAFADRLIEASGFRWPIQDQERAHGILQSGIQRMVISPMEKFGVLSKHYETKKITDKWERQEVAAFQLTPLGLGLLKSLVPENADA